MEYKMIFIPFIALVSAQIIKFTFESIKAKKLLIDRLINGNGGMPSSHTSFTFALLGCVYVKEGMTSSLFAVTLIFSLITAYDALGLRMESGKQAAMINKITAEMGKKKFKKLQEKLGHKPEEVVVGIIYGFSLGYFLMKFL